MTGKKPFNFFPRVLPVVLFFLTIALFLQAEAASSAFTGKAWIVDLERGYLDALSEEAWRIEHWRNHLRSRGITTAIVSGAQLEGRITDCQLLILPNTKNLNERQTSEIRDFVNRGNYLILTGRTGETSPGRQVNSLATELGLRYSSVPISNETAPFVIMNTPSFFTSGIAPGQMLFTGEAGEYVSLAETRAEILAYWYKTGGEQGFDYWMGFPAAAASTLGRGKYLWLGPTIDMIGGDIDSTATISKLLDNALNWFSGHPVAEINPWQRFYDSAIIFAQDTESGFGNTLEVLRLRDLPPTTFFVLTDLARTNLHVMRALDESRSAEIAVHGDSHDVFRGQSYEKQLARFKAIIDFKAETVNAEVVGFRPPEEQYDFYTLRAMIEMGFEYIFADDWPTRASPKMLNVQGMPIVQFPLLNEDDIKIIVEQRLTDNERILEEYLRDMDFIFHFGGLYMFDFHSHVLASNRHIQVLKDIITHLDFDKTWATSCIEMARWWKSRENVEIRLTRSADRFIDVDVINNNPDKSVLGISCSVRFPNEIRSARVETPPRERRTAGFELRKRRAIVLLPELQPLENFRFRILWEN